MPTSTSSCFEMSHLTNNALSPGPALFKDDASSLPASSVKQYHVKGKGTK